MSSKVKKNKKPWPTKDAMAQVYKKKLWGGEVFDFYSGEGSHKPEVVNSYLEVVTSFLNSFKEPLIVCDFGCGDFNVGKGLTKYAKKYIAVDIVEELINRNKNLFRQNNLEFHCLDIVTAELPTGDCIILRQVLQHLSNKEVQAIVAKIIVYKYIILTEHIPNGDFIPNKDIISGQGIRLKKLSGVNLLKVPFNLKTIENRTLDEIVLDNNKGRIVTTLFRVY